MNIALWIVAGLLAVTFLASGAQKLARSRQQLAASGMTYADDFSTPTIKTIGILEIIGAIGLVLPLAVNVAAVLTPLAATGLVVLMAGALVRHIRHRESRGVVVTTILLALSLFVALGRFLSW
jgi:uncharacterized membrane protein YphA (DoxX/SURF4 family)